MKVDLISFDLDNTLWDLGHVISNAEDNWYRWLITEIKAAEDADFYMPTHSDWHEIRECLINKNPILKAMVSTLRIQMAEDILMKAGFSLDTAKLKALEAFDVFMMYRNQVCLYEDAWDTLFNLKPHFKLAAITNGNADLEAIGLTSCFDVVVSAQSVGVRKPDRMIFDWVLNELNIKAEMAVHVGDHVQEDVLGALDAGWQAIWFNPKGLNWPSKQVMAFQASSAQFPPIQIQSLRALRALV